MVSGAIKGAGCCGMSVGRGGGVGMGDGVGTGGGVGMDVCVRSAFAEEEDGGASEWC